MKLRDSEKNWNPPALVCNKRGLVMPFLLIVLWMFLWHFSKAIVDRVVTKRSWNRLASYAIGYEVNYPSVDMITNRVCRMLGKSQPETDEVRVIVAVSYHVAAIAAGFGTAIGWAVWGGYPTKQTKTPLEQRKPAQRQNTRHSMTKRLGD